MKTKDLKVLLKKLKPTFTKDEFGEYVYWIDDKLIAYNGEVSIIVPTENLGMKFTLPSKEFEKLISKIKSKEINIRLENSEVIIESDNLTVSFHNNEELLSRLDINTNIEKSLKKLPSNFLEGVKKVKFSIGKDKNYDMVNTMCVRDNTLVTYDHYGMSMFEIEEKMPYCLIPQNAVNQLNNYDLVEYCVDEKFIYFRSSDNIYFISVLIEGDFWDTSEVFEGIGDILTFPKETINLLELSKVTASEDKEVRVTLLEGVLEIKSTNLKGTVITTLEIDSEMEFDFLVKIDFFINMLKISDEIIIRDNYELYVGKDNLKYAVMIYAGETEEDE